MHIVSKTYHNFFFTSSKFCDFCWNSLIKTLQLSRLPNPIRRIKTDFQNNLWSQTNIYIMSLFRQLCGQSNNFQPGLYIICSLRPPGGWGPRLTIMVNSSFKHELTLKVSLGLQPPGGRMKPGMSKTGWKLLIWPQSCPNNDRSVFMRAFQKKITKFTKSKKNIDQFFTQYASRLLQPIYIF